VKAIIIDVDGVLIKGKDEHGKYLWRENIKQDLGLDPDLASQVFMSNWSDVIKGCVDAKHYFTTVFNQLKIDVPVDTFIDYWLTHDLNINKEILPILSLLSNYKRYLGTNQEQYRASFLQKTFGPYIDGIFCSYQIGAMKPEFEFFKHIETTLGLPAHEIAFIDDTLSHVTAASERGWVCHHYKNIEEFDDFVKSLLSQTA